MKKLLCILLAVSFVFSLAACGTEPRVDENLRTQYQYPKKYDIHGKYSMKNAVKDTNELYAAICKAYPDRPVLTIIRQSYSGEIYPLELNDALNTWLEEKGYGFAVMVYSFGTYELKNGKTFEMQVKEYVDAGGRCDIIATGANIASIAGIPGDTIWDYVEDGLIVPVGSLATEEQLKAVSDMYGEDYLTINSDKGEIYGFSATTLESSNIGGYLASYDGTGVAGEEPGSVRDILFLNEIPDIPGVDRVSGRVKEGRDFLNLTPERNDIRFGSSFALSETVSVENFINSVLIDESYTKVNMLPLYIHETEAGAEVVALWEIPLFDEIMQGYVEAVEEGYLDINSPRDSGLHYYFESYADIKTAKKAMDKEIEVSGGISPRYIIYMSNVQSVTGPECSLFVANASENKDLATNFVISALTDGALGEVLYMGVEGVSYTVENGVRKDIMNITDGVIYPNNLYRLPTENELAESREIVREMQAGAEFDLYENFNADLSECQEEAKALAAWMVKYQNALWLFGDDAISVYGYNMKTFLEDPNYPDIEKLRASVERQLSTYESIYR